MLIYRIYQTETLTTMYADEYGESYDILPDGAELVESPPFEDALDNVRKRRNELLFSCDWTQLPDAPLSTSQKGAWRQYRQSLRDMMATLVWNQSTWPTPPDDSMENSPILDG
jgi:hypothetical protein